jgi:hypothetical protein
LAQGKVNAASSIHFARLNWQGGYVHALGGKFYGSNGNLIDKGDKEIRDDKEKSQEIQEKSSHTRKGGYQ